jgi:hypothetical protein
MLLLLIFYNLGQLMSEADFSLLQTYYWRSHPFWAHFVPYHPVLSVAILVVNFLTACAWNYADIFIVVCSRALYYKFKLLVDQTETHLLSKNTTMMFDKMHGMVFILLQVTSYCIIKLNV